MAPPLVLLVSTRPSNLEPDPRPAHEGAGKRQWDSNWDFREQLGRKESAGKDNNEGRKKVGQA